MQYFRFNFKLFNIKLFLLCLILIGVLVWLFLAFVNDIRKEAYGLSCDHVDVLVTLTGGMGRLDRGLSMLLSGRGDFLVISGVNESSDIESIFFIELREKKYIPPDKVIVEKGSKSTYENAIATKEILRQRGFRSLILITSRYHMKRALYAFRRVMPEDVSICPYPVDSPNFRLEGWWRDGRTFFILLTEFVKFYWYRLFLSLYS